MRDCGGLIGRLEKYPEELAYIRGLMTGDKDLFLAIRNNYMNIYYMGGSVAKIAFGRKKDAKEFVYFKVHEKYLKEPEKYTQEKGTHYVRLTFQEHREEYKQIKEQIKNIALGQNEAEHKKKTREKICQQWIINENNKADSDWYYIDMEYTMEKKPSGRFDMIAIKKKADENNKHKVALVELKIGNNCYCSMNGTRCEEIIERGYEKGKSSVYEYQNEKYISFGSGLLGHLCDYMRFLYSDGYDELKEEIVRQIESLRQAKFIDDHHFLNGIVSKAMLSDKPEVFFVSFSKVPGRTEDEEVSVDTMRESFYKYMYSAEKGSGLKSSVYSAEDFLNTSEIKGLLDIKQKFLTTDNPKFELEIGKESFTFHCNFIDENKTNAWNCL